jgi:hypothetical protein
MQTKLRSAAFDSLGAWNAPDPVLRLSARIGIIGLALGIVGVA